MWILSVDTETKRNKSSPMPVRKKCSYKPQTKRCLLCLNKNLEITAYKEHKEHLLNKRNQIVSKCRQQLKYALARYDTKN